MRIPAVGSRLGMEFTVSQRACTKRTTVGCRDPAVSITAAIAPMHKHLTPARFHVDFGSSLYYDPTPLLEVLKQQRPQEEDHLQPPAQPSSMQPQDFRHESPRITRNPSASAMQPNYVYGSPRHPQHQPAAFNTIPPGHFYGDPRAVGGMGNMSPDIRRRTGRVGPDEGFIALHGP